MHQASLPLSARRTASERVIDLSPIFDFLSHTSARARLTLKHIMKTRHHEHDDHHDDFGGLQRDLGATGAAIDRRGLLRLAARFGVGAGALTLIGCGSTPASPDETGSR